MGPRKTPSRTNPGRDAERGAQPHESTTIWKKYLEVTNDDVAANLLICTLSQNVRPIESQALFFSDGAL